MFNEEEEEQEDEDLEDFKVLVTGLGKQGYEDLETADFDVLNSLVRRQKLIDTKKEDVTSYLNVYSTVFKAIYDNLSTSKATLEGSTGENAEYLRDNVSAEKSNPAYIAAERIASSILAVKKDGSGREDSAIIAEKVFQFVLKSGVDLSDTDAEALMEYLRQIIPKIIAYNKSVGKKEENNKRTRRYSAEVLLKKPKALLQSMAGSLDKFSFVKNIWAEKDNYTVKCPVCGKKIKLQNAPVMLVLFASSRANVAGNFEKYFLHLPVQCGCGAYMLLTNNEYEEIDKAVTDNYKLPSASTARLGMLASAMQQVTQLCSGASCLVVEPPASVFSTAIPHLIREPVTKGEAVEDVQGGSFIEPVSALKFDSEEFLEAVVRFKNKLNTFKRIPVAGGGVKGSGNPAADVSYTGEEPLTGFWDKSALPESTLAATVLNALSKPYAEEKSRALFSFIYHVQENPVLSDCLDYSEIIDLEQTLLLLNGLTERVIPYLEPDRRASLLTVWSYMNTVYGLGFNYNSTEEKKILELLDHSVYIEKALKERIARRKAALDFLDFYKEAFGYLKIINVSSIAACDFDRYVCDEVSWKLADEISDLMLVNNYAEDYYEVWKTYGVLDHGHLDDLLQKKTGQAGILVAIDSRFTRFFKKNGASYGRPGSMSLVVSPVSGLHASVRKCCVQVQNLNYYRFLKCVEELPENLECIVPPELSFDYESARKRLVLLAAGELAGKKEYEYYLRDFSPDELEGWEDELELFTFGRWVLKRREGESISSYVERFKAAESAAQDYQHSEDYLEKFMYSFNDVLTLAAVAVFSNIEYQSYNTAVFIVQSLRFINNKGDRKLLQSFLNVSDDMLNVIENCTVFADSSFAEISLCNDFYRVLNGNYFTSAGEVVNKYYKQAYKEMLSVYDGIGTKASNRKEKLLASLAMEIENVSEQPAEPQIYGYEDMIGEVLEKVNGEAARKIMEG